MFTSADKQVDSDTSKAVPFLHSCLNKKKLFEIINHSFLWQEVRH